NECSGSQKVGKKQQQSATRCEGGTVRTRITLVAMLVLLWTGMGSAAEDKPLLAQQPTVSKTTIIFTYGGYLWSVPREATKGMPFSRPMARRSPSADSMTGIPMCTSCLPPEARRSG